MSADRLRVGIPEERQGKIRSWTETSSLLKEMGFDLEDHHFDHSRKFVKTYFEAQKYIVEGNRIKAKGKFQSLQKKTGYQEFKEENHLLLSIIDIAVRGTSNWNPNL